MNKPQQTAGHPGQDVRADSKRRRRKLNPDRR
jgi:hypothetical protein